VPERLYYTQPSLVEFDAVVTAASRVGDRPAVVLDATAFYPTSGGQPCDTGSLGEARVVDVVESDEGDVLHLLDRALAPGQRVHGRIDADRRFDHMQQHTGQHVLSAAFDRLHRARTVGFHLGAAVSTVDLSVELSPQDIAAAETEANRIVWENRVVSIRFVSEAEAASLPLRKDPDRGGTLRVIEVAGYDLSACGGTHVAGTGSIGLIGVLSSERLRGGTRLEFVCGGRALRSFRTHRDSVAACIRRVSVVPEELPAAVERLQADLHDHRKALRNLQERLAGYDAAALAARAEAIGGGRRVVEAVDGCDQIGLNAMASSMCTAAGFEVALFSTSPPYVVVVARSADRPLDCGRVVRALTARFGGRGGGKAERAQGGGMTGRLEEILQAARDQMTNAAA
jgi:alanyl-tRNA synthetase